MNCPRCETENAADARRCSRCGAKLARRPRRRSSDDSNTPFIVGPDSRNPTALTAYRCGVWGLIPFLGLVLGPAALVLGIVAWRQDRVDPAGPRSGPAVAAIILGTLILLTNWAGLVLMVIGLSGNTP